LKAVEFLEFHSFFAIINGMNIHGKSVREIRENGLAHISEDRMVFGCAGTLSIKENIIADRFRKKEFRNSIFLNEKKINQEVDGYIREFEIACDDRDQPVRMLSGGNIQKVVVAREFTSGANVILANQPTRGIDVGTAEMIRKTLLRKVREENVDLSQFILKYVMKDVSMPSLASLKYPEELKLAVLVPKTEIHAGLIIAAVCVVLVVIAIYKTPFGYAMRTVGSNPNFAKYAGISVTGTVVEAQIIGGAFAGLGGAVEILGRYERFRWLEMPNYGFDGLIVAVMAHRNPALVPVGALLLAYIRTGADIVTRTTDIPAEFVSIVQGIIILLIAAEMFLSGLKRRMIFKSARESLENTEKQQEAVKA